MSSRRQLLFNAAARLTAAGASDARLDAEWLLSHALNVPRLMLLADAGQDVPPNDAERYEALVVRRAEGQPLQYVLGEADFMGRTFQVDARVLIPRCDTETLCEAVTERLRAGMRVVDIGTGSGALAVSAALACPGAEVTGVDISAEALAVARANGEWLGARVRWVQSDLFDALQGETFDLVVSNPPYIPTRELVGLQREVRQEPSLALDGGPDGLAFYRRIVASLPAHLRRGGSLLLEIGDGQAEDVTALFMGKFDQIRTLRDLSGLKRVVAGDGYAG